MKPKTAVYAGSFDPITHGHLNIATRGASLVDKLIIAVGENPKKKYMFPLHERIQMIEESVQGVKNVVVSSFQGLLVDFCRNAEAQIILRGLRAATDFDFEFQIGLANMDMASDIETVFLLSEPKNIFISSSLVKEIASHGGDVQQYLPKPALIALRKQYQFI
jgi:pantetheine-phosphate adenylyltransferase